MSGVTSETAAFSFQVQGANRYLNGQGEGETGLTHSRRSQGMEGAPSLVDVGIATPNAAFHSHKEGKEERGNIDSWRLILNQAVAALSEALKRCAGRSIPGCPSTLCCSASSPALHFSRGTPMPCSFLPLLSQTCANVTVNPSLDGFYTHRLVFPPSSLSPCTAPSQRMESGIACDLDL